MAEYICAKHIHKSSSRSDLVLSLSHMRHQDGQCVKFIGGIKTCVLQVSRGGPFLGVTTDGSLAAAHSSTSQYMTTSDLQAAAFGAAVLVLILVQFAMYATSQHFSKKTTTSAKAM